MPYYETVFVMEPSLDEQQTENQLSTITGMIESKGGSILKIERWGKRKLAYPIKHRKEGYYFLVESNAPGDMVDSLEKHFRIQETVLRYLTVRRDKPSPEGESSLLAQEGGTEGVEVGEDLDTEGDTDFDEDDDSGDESEDDLTDTEETIE